jgi:hypothetical protein
LLAASHAWAADETRVQLEQRIRLAARLMADSATAQRIVASGNSQAVGHYEEGRVHQNLAEEALARGDLGAARKEVDDALRHVGQARRLVPDGAARQAAAHTRYDQMLASLERLIDSWRAQAGPNQQDDGDLLAALGLIGTARNFADYGRYEESVHVLGTAEGHVLSGMRRVLQSRELNYTARASTPAEEYQLELQRHSGLGDLLPLAINELKPRPETRAQVERHGQASQSLREQSLRQFQGGDTAAALAQIRNATLMMQRALQTAGLTLPQATGSSP